MNHKLRQNKIFMFSSVHVWSDTRIFFKEAKTLVENGFEVDFYAMSGTTEYEDTIPNLQVTTLARGGKWSRPKTWRTLYKAALQSDASCYHFHDFELLPVAVKLKKRKPGARIIYDMHENFPAMMETKDWIPALFRKPFSRWIAKKERDYIPHCDHLIFAESSYKKHYADLDIPKTDILNLPIWEARQEREKDTVFTFIYVGDIIQDRGVFNMIELMHELKLRGHDALKLKLIGPMQSHVETEVMKCIVERDLVNNVEWLGRLPYNEIWDHYGSAHVGLCLLHPIPNYMHSLATKIFEYMAAGLPILATNIPDWEALMAETDTGFTVDVWDGQAVADKAEQFIAKPALCKDFARHGRRAFETRYNWTTEAGKLIHIYSELNDGKQGMRK
ncbi:glycosyl transferases group 1 family protein [Listeria grandensis FSL F6-0971]|uniref:Glycosyl transferases group 1 family protein n=1 Tax=Listeria grandensis FSL F6-0971 TaxID=1265819 RepID=W7BAU5_9LIST|nr:glycosyltransferase family 4 protein [Listeria grandensis]EUJ23147.1 glycosyl transferases group 1 family protein [Listeria grandensis FSL F6-0971]